MGAGKSSVGRELAARLGRSFVDTDSQVEEAAGMAVSELFEREGEAGFRARERAAIEAVAGRVAVVSLGGGAVAQPGVGERLASTGTVVYLRARPETLLRRVGEGGERPLLANLDAAGRLERIRSLLAERGPLYERAQIVIDTDEHDAGKLAQTLAERLQELAT